MAYAMGGYISFVYLAMIPLLGCGLGFIIHRVGPIFTRVFRKYDALNESVEENVTGMRVVKSYVRENYEKEKFARAAEDVRTDFTRAEKLLALNNPMMNLCVNGAFVVIIYLGSKLIITSQGTLFDVGQLSSTFTYGFQILMSLMQLSMIFVMVTMSEESANRIVEVLKAEPTITNPAEAAREVTDGSIDFDHVSFKYSEHGTRRHRPAYRKRRDRRHHRRDRFCQVHAREPHRTPVRRDRGHRARGRARCALLRPRCAAPRGGHGAAEKRPVQRHYRGEPALGRRERHPWIEQGGSNVSGGQKQRLCIARALLRRPKILILDDSTSAVDTKTDAKIRAGLAAYLPETTKLIIAQRIASVQDADRIIVMEGGRIAAMGTHEELLETSEIYRETFTSQNKMGEETVDGDGPQNADDDASATRETSDADRQTAAELTRAFETTMQEGGEAHE